MSDGRRGSVLSDKQIARAAIDRRHVFFWGDGGLLAAGLVVGMDDYHWMVYGETKNTSVGVSLVHKTAPLVSIGHEATPGEIGQAAIVGQDFWDYCERTYAPKKATL